VTTTRSLMTSSLVAGGITLLVSALAFAESLQYPMGTIRQIGPAIFPLSLSILLAIAGVAIIVEDLRDGVKPESAVPLNNILAVVGGPIALALLITPFGLVPAITASVLISALADRTLKLRSALMVAAVLSIGCTLVFVTLLKLPIDPINWPF